MMSWACGRRSIGNVRAKRLAVALPHRHDLRGDRGGGPGVHDVEIAGESARHDRADPPCSPAARRSTDRAAATPRRPPSARRNRCVPSLEHGIPDRKRHAEEPLAADAPVAVQAVHPVLVARAHVLRVPLQLAAALEQLLAELDGLDEPLPAGDDLERTVALLVELHRMGDRTRLALQVAARLQQLGDLGLRLLRGEALQVRLYASCARGASSDSHPGSPKITSPSVPFGCMTPRTGSFSSRHQVTSVSVTERADHRDAAALFRGRPAGAPARARARRTAA